jgi:hypothetical protein
VIGKAASAGPKLGNAIGSASMGHAEGAIPADIPPSSAASPTAGQPTPQPRTPTPPPRPMPAPRERTTA